MVPPVCRQKNGLSLDTKYMQCSPTPSGTRVRLKCLVFWDTWYYTDDYAVFTNRERDELPFCPYAYILFICPLTYAKKDVSGFV